MIVILSGLHRLQGGSCHVLATHGRSVCQEAFPQGILSDRGAFGLLSHAKRPQRREETHGRAHRPTHARDHPSLDGPEPHPSHRRCHHQLRTARRQHPRRRRRCGASSSRRHVPFSTCQLRTLPIGHRCTRSQLPQPQNHGRMPRRRTHQRSTRIQ